MANVSRTNSDGLVISGKKKELYRYNEIILLGYLYYSEWCDKCQNMINKIMQLITYVLCLILFPLLAHEKNDFF